MSDLLYAAVPDGVGGWVGPSSGLVRKRVLARGNGHAKHSNGVRVVVDASAPQGQAVTLQFVAVQVAHPGRLCQDCTGPARQLATHVAPTSGGGLSYYCGWHAHPGCTTSVPVRL